MSSRSYRDSGNSVSGPRASRQAAPRPGHQQSSRASGQSSRSSGRSDTLDLENYIASQVADSPMLHLSEHEFDVISRKTDMMGDNGGPDDIRHAQRFRRDWKAIAYRPGARLDEIIPELEQMMRRLVRHDPRVRSQAREDFNARREPSNRSAEGSARRQSLLPSAPSQARSRHESQAFPSGNSQGRGSQRGGPMQFSMSYHESEFSLEMIARRYRERQAREAAEVSGGRSRAHGGGGYGSYGGGGSLGYGGGNSRSSGGRSSRAPRQSNPRAYEGHHAQDSEGEDYDTDDGFAFL